MNDSVQLVPLNATNWERCAAVAPAPGQEVFLQSNLFVMARSLFEPLKIFAIEAEGGVVGMMALYCKDQVLWISHILVDHSCQGRGIGRKAVERIPLQAVRDSLFQEMRAGVAAGNHAGADFFSRLGFVPGMTLPDGETIFRKPRT